jgi:hypothetical protein
MRLDELKNQVIDQIAHMTDREKLLFIGMIMFGLSLLTMSITSSLAETFSLQRRRIQALEKNFSSAAFVLDRYENLKNKLTEMQKTFKNEGPPGGMRSYLEEAITKKAGVTAPNFTIKAAPSVAVGENYSKFPYTVTFSTVSIGKIVEFLEEITNNESNLLLTKLEITKGRMGEKLNVVVDVSNVTNAQQ